MERETARRPRQGASSNLQDFVQFVASTLAESSEAVHVDVVEREHTVIIHLTVPPDDLGKVIGKQGKIARAMRSLLNVAGTRRGKRVILEIR